MSDLFFGACHGHFERAVQKLKDWLKKDKEEREQWAPLTTDDLHWMEQYQKHLAERNGFKVESIWVELEVRNLKTGLTEKQVVKIDKPLTYEMAQNVGFPEYGATSAYNVFSLMVVAGKKK